ncbi:AraC family transcriptional regulator [Arenibacter sp. TNZ]|jgi:AraC-like DNA-binding protein|uniref:AraC family transcriptional regulator n=1 Tax=Arenibacter TaxID=178469 RepID=UPI000CD4940C|nr:MULTISPECIES: helix-turn-helix transcriptional regulator [Arenibacter]MCM4173738.1 AraC family transcriptional regulator [Arenibacter sp. TNZ]
MKVIPILNIQQFEQDIPPSNFYSNGIKDHLEKNKDHFHKPHKHNFFLCILFSKGTGIHEIDFDRYTISPGSVFFLRPGQTHYWKFESAPKGYIFFHTQDFYELHFSKSKLEQFPFYYTHKNTPLLQLPSKEVNFLELRFKELNDEYYMERPYKYQKIASLINATYIDLARQYSLEGHSKDTTSSMYLETLRLLEKNIEKNFRTKKSAQFYADKLNITSKHLNRIVKTTLGKTTTDLITERVILESKRLIVHSANSLSAISEILGYQDYAYFSKMFKIKTKTTPLEFKKGYK